MRFAVRSMRSVERFGLAILMLAAIVAGCGRKGPETVEVSGVVTLDGQPVEGATVGFAPESGGRPASGVTDASGAFTLSTFAPGDGAVPGKHKVTVSKIRSTGQQGDPNSTSVAGEMPLSGLPGSGGVKIEWVVPKKYTDPTTSGLSVEVNSDMEQVKLELTSK